MRRRPWFFLVLVSLAFCAPCANGSQAATCGGSPNVGYRIRTFSSGLRAAVWYPALSAEAGFQYSRKLSSTMALDAPVAGCGSYPLVVFSHGFGGCGIQSVFFTEELARHGYIVVAPDHKDALCKVDEPRLRFRFVRPHAPFFLPSAWSDSTYADRRDDIALVIREMLADPEFGPRIDRDRVGCSGHSLGGYTALGIAGAWESWRDGRIRAALLFSPFASPYLSRKTLGGIHIPVMYQGGTRDLGVTPFLKRHGGAYDSSNPPKYFVEFRHVSHLGFTDMVCGRYLKDKPGSTLEKKLPGVADLRYEVR